MRTKAIMLLVVCLFLSSTVFCLNAGAVKEMFMVQMRDGIKLATDVYRPDTGGPYPVILYRTPYWRLLDHPDGTYWNNKGCILVAQDVRGRFGSEGVDSVFLDDGWGVKQDGYDTIEWITQQVWCDDKVGMLGSSARGITTYRAAGALHPDLIACAPSIACSDFYHEVVFPGGEFSKSLIEDWLQAEGCGYMVDYFFSHPYYEDKWGLMNLGTRTDSITAPILQIGGWYDCFSNGPVAVFNGLRDKAQAGPQKLVMGPWIHTTVGTSLPVGELQYPDAAFDVDGYVERWMDYWLLGIQNGVLDEPNVHYYLMGDPDKTGEPGCEWVEADVWPPENTVPVAYFLADSNALMPMVPSILDSLTYTYDPRDPVPTLGGNNLSIEKGPYDQRPIGQRPDILEFCTGVLLQPLRVEGVVTAELFVSSDHKDTDFTLKLVDVYPDGREMLVTDGIARARFRFGDSDSDVAFLIPGEIARMTVTLPPTALVWNSGHRIKICISSSNYPRFEINPNTDDPLFQPTDTVTANNTVYYGDSCPSAVILPVVGESVFASESQVAATEHAPLTNYPNPFSSHTVISYNVPGCRRTVLTIYDTAGRKVRALVAGTQQAGMQDAVWDGRDDNDCQVNSGVYFCTLSLGEASPQVRKILLMRRQSGNLQ
jgi:hypothetical protein